MPSTVGCTPHSVVMAHLTALTTDLLNSGQGPQRLALCFDATLSYEIKTMKGAGVVGGGLFGSVFTG